jgi:hypothetical protein
MADDDNTTTQDWMPPFAPQIAQGATMPQLAPSPAPAIAAPPTAYQPVQTGPSPAYNPWGQQSAPYYKAGNALPDIPQGPTYQQQPMDTPEMQKLDSDLEYNLTKKMADRYNDTQDAHKKHSIAKLGLMMLGGMGAGLAGGARGQGLGSGNSFVSGQIASAREKATQDAAQERSDIDLLKELHAAHKQGVLDPLKENNDKAKESYEQVMKAREEARRTLAQQQGHDFQIRQQDERERQGVATRQHMDNLDQLGLSNFNLNKWYKSNLLPLESAKADIEQKRWDFLANNDLSQADASRQREWNQLNEQYANLSANQNKFVIQHNTEVDKQLQTWVKNNPGQQPPQGMFDHLQVDPSGITRLAPSPYVPPQQQGLMGKAQSLGQAQMPGVQGEPPKAPSLQRIQAQPNPVEAAAPKLQSLISQHGEESVRTQFYASAKKKGYNLQESRALWDQYTSKKKVGSDNTIWGISDKGFAPGYPAAAKLPLVTGGWIRTPGTIDLSKRHMFDNPQPGSSPEQQKYEYGSEESVRDRLPNGDWMTYSVFYDGKKHTPQEAFEHAKQTGEHMGIIRGDAPEKLIDQYENFLHARKITVNGRFLDGDEWKRIRTNRNG